MIQMMKKTTPSSLSRLEDGVLPMGDDDIMSQNKVPDGLIVMCKNALFNLSIISHSCERAVVGKGLVIWLFTNGTRTCASVDSAICREQRKNCDFADCEISVYLS